MSLLPTPISLVYNRADLIGVDSVFINDLCCLAVLQKWSLPSPGEGGPTSVVTGATISVVQPNSIDH